MSLQKNVASQKWRVFAFDVTTGVAKTGDAANITAKIAKDWAAADATNDVNPTETEDGYYNFDLTQAESNADALDLFPESSTADIAVIGVPGSQSTIPIAFADNPVSDVPTVAEFNARTLVAADYFDPATDAVADVTLVATTTTNTDMRGTDSALTDKAGFSLSTAGILAIWHQALAAIVTVGSIGKLIKDEITAVRMAVLTDWIDGGRLDLLLDAIPTTAMRGTDNAALASVATEARLAELDAANLPTDVASTLSNTVAGLVDTAEIGTAGVGLSDLGGMSTGMKAEVNVEVDLALDTPIPELGVAAPTATPTVRTGIMFPYMGIRNQFKTQTSGVDAIEFRNNAGVIIAKKLITDDGADYNEDKVTSG